MKYVRLFFFVGIFIDVSCTPYKQTPYFQDLRRDSIVNEKISNYSALIMQPGDLLGINVSSLNPEADMIYNSNSRNLNPAVVSYLIDKEGNIKLPIIGTIKAAGYTTKEISSELESKLQVYLSKPTVDVRMLNFKIAVLGDVKAPGNFNIQNEKITFMEALSLAGDLNSTGLRNNVLLIREIDGDRQYINMNLTSKVIFSSPYYYLKNNDIIYVQPGRAKLAVDRGDFQKVGAVLAAISILTFLFRRN